MVNVLTIEDEIDLKNLTQILSSKNYTQINIPDSGLSSITDEIKLSSDLTDLNLSDNSITVIPEWFGPSFPYLTKLNLSNNNISKIPKSFGDLRNSLVELNISKNKVAFDDFKDILRFSKLKILEISVRRNFHSIFESIKHSKNGTQLTTFSYLPDLTILSISGGQLTNIDVSLLHNLTSLSLTYNNLSSLPTGIENLSNLQILNLSHNNIKTVSSSIGNLKKLKYLNLSFNKIKILNENIGNLTRLDELLIQHNKISSIPLSIGSIGIKKPSISLNVSYNRLTNIPDSIGNIHSLKYLDLSNNNIGILPESIGKLNILHTLNLSNNKLSVIPDSLGNCKNLKKLYLTDNKLSVIPDSLGNCKNLKILEIQENYISSIPENILILPKLRPVEIKTFFVSVDLAELIKQSKKVKFGVEIEACVNWNGTKEEETSIDDFVEFFNWKTKTFITNKKITSPDLLEWVEADVDAYKTGSYNKWAVTTDGSLECGEDPGETAIDYYCLNKDNYLDCKTIKLEYKAVEMVSPILNMEESNKNFKMTNIKCGDGPYLMTYVLLGWLLGDRMTYNVNTSQGLHVNLSHPQMNLLRLVKIWFVFEPVILGFITQLRKLDLGYSEPLRDMMKTPTEENLSELKKDKYVACNIKNKGRIEIRIHHATLDPENLNNWVLFLILLMASSILIDIDIDRFANLSKNKLFDLLFSGFILDTRLETYYRKKYNQHKNPEDSKLEERNIPIQIEVFPSALDIINKSKTDISLIKELQEFSPYPMVSYLQPSLLP